MDEQNEKDENQTGTRQTDSEGDSQGLTPFTKEEDEVITNGGEGQQATSDIRQRTIPDPSTDESTSTLLHSGEIIAEGSLVEDFTVSVDIEFFEQDTVESQNRLPVAVPFNEETSSIEEQESVIYGEVIRPDEDRKCSRRLTAVLVVTALVFILTLSTALVKSNNSKESSSSSPSLSPNVLLPFNYSQFVKDLLIPISGEEILDDPRSAQHLLWKMLSGYEEFYIDHPEYIGDERLVQAYVIGLVQISFGVGFGHQATNDIEFESRQITFGGFRYHFGLECWLYACDEKKRITGIIFKNQKHSDMGGGTIPKEIGALKRLRFLILSNNGFTGTIPTEIGNLTNLHTLDLQRNELSGSIPSELSKIQNLLLIDLSENKLTSTIPPEIGTFEHLNYIEFSQNKLTGSVPIEILDLNNLKGLDVHQNDLIDDFGLLCTMNFTNEDWSMNYTTGSPMFPFYKYSAQLGLRVDCFDNIASLWCTCCICVL